MDNKEERNKNHQRCQVRQTERETDTDATRNDIDKDRETKNRLTDGHRKTERQKHIHRQRATDNKTEDEIENRNQRNTDRNQKTE